MLLKVESCNVFRPKAWEYSRKHYWIRTDQENMTITCVSVEISFFPRSLPTQTRRDGLSIKGGLWCAHGMPSSWELGTRWHLNRWQKTCNEPHLGGGWGCSPPLPHPRALFSSSAHHLSPLWLCEKVLVVPRSVCPQGSGIPDLRQGTSFPFRSCISRG